MNAARVSRGSLMLFDAKTRYIYLDRHILFGVY